MRAFLYCRASTTEQTGDSHYSLAAREEWGREFIKSRGWRLHKSADGGVIVRRGAVEKRGNWYAWSRSSGPCDFPSSLTG